VERGEVEHDGTLGPLRTIGSAGGGLPQEVIVGLSELDVDAAAVRRRHDDQLLLLGVKKLTDTLQHLVGLPDGKRKLESVAVKAPLPLGLLIRVQSADEHIVVPACDGEGIDIFVRGLLTEVRLLPLGECDLLKDQVRCVEILSALQDSLGRSSLDGIQ